MSKEVEPRILVVCTANICRSPVGEVLLRKKLEGVGLGHWKVESAGTWALEGVPAAEFSCQVVASLGMDLSRHRSRTIESLDLRDFALVLCMESGHVEALGVEFPQHRERIFLLAEMAGERRGVRDPIGGARGDYEVMATDVDDLLDRGLKLIVRHVERLQTGP